MFNISFWISPVTCKGLLNISFSPALYIFLEITSSLFTAILQAISKKCQRTALGCCRSLHECLEDSCNLHPPEQSYVKRYEVKRQPSDSNFQRGTSLYFLLSGAPPKRVNACS